jgi:hypothetical protein
MKEYIHMSIQNNPLGNTYTLGGKVNQLAGSLGNIGNNSAIANNATQKTPLGRNDAFVSQDIASLFLKRETSPSSGDATGFSPSEIVALGKKHSRANQIGYDNLAAGYRHITQVYTLQSHFHFPGPGVAMSENGGSNKAYGTNFNDHIVQNGSSNTASSGQGNDFISVKGARNTVDAGDGNDTITIKQMANAEQPSYSILDGGNGDDTVKLYGNSSDWQENNGPVGNFVPLPNGHFYINKNTGDVVQLTDIEHLTFAGDKKTIDIPVGS